MTANTHDTKAARTDHSCSCKAPKQLFYIYTTYEDVTNGLEYAYTLKEVHYVCFYCDKDTFIIEALRP
jgi:hypothetical protein